MQLTTLLDAAHVSKQSSSSEATCPISKSLKSVPDVIKLNWCKFKKHILNIYSFILLIISLVVFFLFRIWFLFCVFYSVTMNNSDNSTEKICINTEGRMAKAFLKCWERYVTTWLTLEQHSFSKSEHLQGSSWHRLLFSSTFMVLDWQTEVHIRSHFRPPELKSAHKCSL